MNKVTIIGTGSVGSTIAYTLAVYGSVSEIVLIDVNNVKAEGEAMAILTVQKAVADGIAMLNQAQPTNQVLTIKSLEALEKVADGKATKLIIPSEIQNLAGLIASVKELTEETR